MYAKTGARNLLQNCFRDNCIGIDVGGIQWDKSCAGMAGKFLFAMVVSSFYAANGEVAGNGGKAAAIAGQMRATPAAPDGLRAAAMDAQRSPGSGGHYSAAVQYKRLPSAIQILLR